MRAAITTRTVKEIRIDIEKCTGCRACEMACSAFHARPRYSSVNPARSRIRVVTDEINDEYVPVRAQSARALAKIGRVDVLPALDRAAREDKESAVVAAAREAAAALRAGRSG